MPEWFSYANTFNNPVNFTNPTGMVPQGGGCEGADCDDPPADFRIELDEVIVTADKYGIKLANSVYNNVMQQAEKK